MLRQNENYTMNEPPNNREASTSGPEYVHNKFGDNFYTSQYIRPQTVPVDRISYEAHEYHNFVQPPSSVPSEITFIKAHPSSDLQLGYIHKNDSFMLQNTEQQVYTTSNVTLNSDIRPKSGNIDQSAYFNSGIRHNKIVEDCAPVQTIIEVDLSKKIDLEPKLSERKRKIEKTVKLIENVLINTKSAPESDPLRLTDIKKELSDSDDEVLIKKVVLNDSQTKESNITMANETNPNCMNESELKENHMKTEILTNVKVKIEHTSWPDIDCMNPFHRDCNGMPKHGVGNLKVINMENSVEEALDVVKNGRVGSSIAYYECPHCSLLLIHPKRFLIHVKWHNFGLKNNKRQIKLMESKRKRKIMNIKKSAEKVEKIVKMEDPKQRIYRCKLCDIVFTGKHSLSSHNKKHHSTDQVQCKICHEMFVGRTELRTHFLTHKEDNGYHQCPNCPKRFKFRHSLMKHADTHLDKTHSCPDCSKKFGSEKLLKAHIKTHERMSRGTTHHCSYCGKGFYENFSLIVHERTHSNDKPFQCDICQSAFVSNSSLKRHYKVSHIANQSKPHTCKVCLKCFSTESIRDRHELRVHADSNVFPYGCQLCEKRFMKMKDLRNHIYKIHPNERPKVKEVD